MDQSQLSLRRAEVGSVVAFGESAHDLAEQLVRVGYEKLPITRAADAEQHARIGSYASILFENVVSVWGGKAVLEAGQRDSIERNALTAEILDAWLVMRQI